MQINCIELVGAANAVENVEKANERTNQGMTRFNESAYFLRHFVSVSLNYFKKIH